MTKKRDEKEHFVLIWNRIHMQMIGAWPNPDKNVRLSNLIAFLIGLDIILFLSIPQTIFAIKIWPDIDLVSESLSVANFPVTIALFKLFVLCKNKSELSELVTDIYEDWKRDKSDFEWEIMKENANISKIITLYSCSFTLSASTLFLIQEVYLNLRGKYEPRQWIYLSYFPYCSPLESPTYEVICLFQLIGGLFVAIVYCGINSFSGMLVLHLYGRFDILKCNIENAINTHEIQRSKLKLIVIEHENLNRFASTIEETFNKVFLLEMLMFSVELCLQGYTMLNDLQSGFTFYDYIFWIAFGFTFLSNLFVVCYMGEKISNTSILMQNSIQQSEWYNLKSTEARDLIMILLLTNKPLQITAGKFCAFSYDTFVNILKRAFGFLSVLRQMNQNTLETK